MAVTSCPRANMSILTPLSISRMAEGVIWMAGRSRRGSLRGWMSSDRMSRSVCSFEMPKRDDNSLGIVWTNPVDQGRQWACEGCARSPPSQHPCHFRCTHPCSGHQRPSCEHSIVLGMNTRPIEWFVGIGKKEEGSNVVELSVIQKLLQVGARGNVGQVWEESCHRP